MRRECAQSKTIATRTVLASRSSGPEAASGTKRQAPPVLPSNRGRTCRPHGFAPRQIGKRGAICVAKAGAVSSQTIRGGSSFMLPAIPTCRSFSARLDANDLISHDSRSRQAGRRRRAAGHNLTSHPPCDWHRPGAYCTYAFCFLLFPVTRSTFLPYIHPLLYFCLVSCLLPPLLAHIP